MWTAWGILILFSTQPLLLGHAFINPKDIPFMFLFTLSIVIGFWLADSMEERESFVSLERPAKALTNKFEQTDPQRRKKFLTLLYLALATIAALLLFSSQINALTKLVVTFFYTADPVSWAGQVFNSIAGHASDISAEDYVTKALKLIHRAEAGMLFAVFLFFLAYFCLLITSPTLPAILRNTWDQLHKLRVFVMNRLSKFVRNSLNLGILKNGFIEVFRALRNPRVILTGIALGLATGVRAIAPWVGIIIFLYLLVKTRFI